MLKKKSTVETSVQKRPEPGLWKWIKEALFGQRRQFDCVQVEVSSRCHGRCGYCPHTTMLAKWPERDMDMDTFSRLWPLMCRTNRVHLQGWGEPFLNPDFFAMAALAKKAGCNVSTTTCGLAMDPERAQGIVTSGIDIVAFSLAGTDAASNALRRGVDFDRVCQGISTLRAARERVRAVYPEIHFAYLLLASKAEAISDLPALMVRLGVGNAVISMLDYLPAPSLKNEAFLPGEREKIEKTAALLKASAAEASSLGLGFHYEFPHPMGSGNGCRENIGTSLFVSVDGALSPCVFVNFPAAITDPNRRVFGNVHEMDPLKIWESDKFRLFRDRLGNGNPDFPCITCPKRFLP